LADTFHSWIRNVIQSSDVFLSLRDIDKGAAWQEALSSNLKTCSYGVFFLTGENRGNPWMHFEAGALSKQLGHARVCPFLFRLHESTLDGPFSQFQAVRCEEDDIFRLVREINAAQETPLKDDVLRDAFETYWPRLHRKLSEIEAASYSASEALVSPEKRDIEDLKLLAKQIVDAHSLHQTGLRAVYSDRIQALKEIREEIDSEAQEVVIIGSSLKGLIGVGGDTAGDQNLIRIALIDSLKRGVKVKILMTSPKIAYLRANQEGRVAGDIEREILENLIYMLAERSGDDAVARNLEIKLYGGTPTIFLVSTSHALFFNPYTYYAKAFESLCYRAGKNTPIFKNYYDHHYLDAWNDKRHATPIRKGTDQAIQQLTELINGTNLSGERIVPDDDIRSDLLAKLTRKSEQAVGGNRR
jgi:hypothetical protein